MITQKELLVAVYRQSFADYRVHYELDPSRSTRQNLGRFLKCSDAELDKAITDATSNGSIRIEKDVVHLTKPGRCKITVVLLGGSFDVIHPGHIETLEQAKQFGDVLVVSVTRDAIFQNSKNHKAFHSEELRCKLVSAIRFVDAVVLGSEVDPFGSLSLEPDIVALGYDQLRMEEGIAAEIKKRNLNTRIVTLKSTDPLIKTTKILSEDRNVLREM